MHKMHDLTAMVSPDNGQNKGMQIGCYGQQEQTFASKIGCHTQDITDYIFALASGGKGKRGEEFCFGGKRKKR